MAKGEQEFCRRLVWMSCVHVALPYNSSKIIYPLVLQLLESMRITYQALPLTSNRKGYLTAKGDAQIVVVAFEVR